jgi:rhamnulokinase
MTLDELNNVDDFRQVVRDNYALTTFTPNPEHEIARFVTQFQQQQTKELCA